MRLNSWIIFSLIAAAALIIGATGVNAEPMKVGIIGLDTSHVVAFTKVMNDPKAEGPLADIQVVAAYPGGSDDVEASYKRVEGFTKTLKEMGVENGRLGGSPHPEGRRGLA